MVRCLSPPQTTHHRHLGTSSCLSWQAVARVAEVAALARPRYHFAGIKNTFYLRDPYINPDLGAGSHVTRFIALAAVGNVAKQKWLHALGLLPAAHMDVQALQQKPEVSSLACGLLAIIYEATSVTPGMSVLRSVRATAFVCCRLHGSMTDVVLEGLCIAAAKWVHLMTKNA